MIGPYAKIWSPFRLSRLLGLSLLCGLGAPYVQVEPVGLTPPGVIILKHERTLESRIVPRLSDDYPPDNPEGRVRPPLRRSMPAFSMKIKNEGPKEIATVVWDYVFIRLRDEKELSRIRFSTKARVKAGGGSVTLRGRLERMPPAPEARVVTVEDIQKGDDRRYREQAEIKCVLYADGTWWRHPGITADGCVRPESAKGK